jgi:hypothetical protein
LLWRPDTKGGEQSPTPHLVLLCLLLVLLLLLLLPIAAAVKVEGAALDLALGPARRLWGQVSA